jgi:hypothetical protein
MGSTHGHYSRHSNARKSGLTLYNLLRLREFEEAELCVYSLHPNVRSFLKNVATDVLNNQNG